MTFGIGVLMLGLGHVGPILQCAFFFLKIFFTHACIWALIKQTLFKINDEQRGFYQNWKFHDPWDRDSCSRTWPYSSYRAKCIIFQKKFSHRHRSNKIMNKEGSTKIVNFLSPEWGLFARVIYIFYTQIWSYNAKCIFQNLLFCSWA